MIAVNRADMALFIEALFRYCDDGGHAALRTFRDDLDGVWRPELWGTPQIADGLGDVISAAFELAEAAAEAPIPVVFCPPIATFKTAEGAAEKDIFNGPTLSIDCDTNPERAREILQDTLGPATVTVASGGVWIDPETGEAQEKVHLHWRLTEPTREFADHIRLKEARRLATILAGADASAVPLVHPLRWPGSVHRKAKPRLARIVDLRADVEIELGDALAQLREAVAAMRSRQNGTDSVDGGDYTNPAGHQPSRFGPEAEALDIIGALTVIANDERNWKRWSDIGMAVWHASSGSAAGYAAFLAWSSKFDGLDTVATRARWEHFAKHPPGAIGAGTLFHLAREAWPGWQKPSDARRRRDNDPGEPPPHVVDPDSDTTSNGATPGDDEEAGWGGPRPEDKPWPEMQAEAFHGIAGEIVETLAPHTEADPVALLLSFLAMAGNMLGRGPHATVGRVRHFLNLFIAFCGESSRGRKGTSEADIKAVMAGADSDWALNQFESGLSSGEGVIWRVHDEITGRERVKDKGQPPRWVNVVKEENVADKRLMIITPEFSGALQVMRREGNILSQVLRDAWDGRALAVLTKHSNARATDAHISMIGHITDSELRECLDRTSLFNGFANRFLFACVRRAQSLPFGGALDEAAIAGLADSVHQMQEQAQVLRRPITFDNEARALWAIEYDLTLATERPGLIGAITARAEAQTLRLATLYAAIGGSYYISRRNLEAALAVWRYCEASAKYIFGDKIGDPLADEIFDELNKAGADGMTRSAISGHFGRHLTSEHLGRALRLLSRHGKVRRRSRSSGSAGGRPTEVWVAA